MLSFVCLFVFFRGGSDQFFEGSGEITAIVKAAFKCDLCNAELTLGEHSFGVFYSDEGEVFRKAEAGNLLEFF